MNGKEILVDTNIVLYLLNGSDTLAEILQGKAIYLSFMTELELIGYNKNSVEVEAQIAGILQDSTIITLNDAIKQTYITVRKKHSLKLADAVIAATAIAFKLPLITADRHFRVINGLNLINYQHGV